MLKLASLIILVTSSFVIAGTRSCWTCSAGYVHWYDAGFSSAPGGDPCACVPSTSPNAPPNYCWTCYPGYIHWWNAGLSTAPDGNQCACVADNTATTTTNPTTTSSPEVPTNTPTDCWTCYSGYIHWWQAGMSAPPGGDRCACVLDSTTTTSTPDTTNTNTPATTTTSTPNYCWTCYPGYIHWWNAGLSTAPDGNQCACVADNTATTTATPTTPSPSNAPVSHPTDCWTCSPEYIHWWNAGLSTPPGGDHCACVFDPNSSSNTDPPTTTSYTTTSSPTTTTTASPTNCWTCSAGYQHWFTAGLSSPPGGDQCACVAIGTANTPAPESFSPAGAVGPYAKYTGAMRVLLDAMSIGSSDTGSVSFSPAVAPYSPWNPPPTSLITELLNILKTTTSYKTLQMYYIDQWTVPLVQSAGFKMLGILSLVGGSDNSDIINAGIAMAKAYPDTIVGIACGNELGSTNGLTWSTVYTVQSCVSALKSAGISQPVGVIDTYDSWCSNEPGGVCTEWSAMANVNVDFIGANIYPYWDDVYSGSDSCTYANNAASVTMSKHKTLMSLYSVPVIATEWGWPGAPAGQTFLNQPNYATGQQCAVCNDDNQKLMVQNMIDIYRNTGIPCNTFEAFRESWKGSSTLSPEVNWGICSGTAPYTCMNAPQ